MRTHGTPIDELLRKDRQLRAALLVLGAGLVAALQIAGALLLLGGSAGCGSRTTGVLPDSAAPAGDARLGASDGGPATDARPEAADAAALDAGPLPEGCVVAIRVDNCCTVAEPALAAQVATDQCLVLYPPRNTPQACLDQWPEQCALVDCAFSPPASRLAEPAPGGGCRWQSECNTATDCELALDARQCCPCPAAYPKSMVAAEACLQPLYMSAWPPPGCTDLPPGCDAAVCGACPQVPQLECAPAGIGEAPGINVCGPFSAWY